MRQLKHKKGTWFTLHHLTWNERKQETTGMRVVERCRLRTALPDDVFTREADMYLPYLDLDKNEPRMCYRKLIRYVAFPPDFEILKVKWL